MAISKVSLELILLMVDVEFLPLKKKNKSFVKSLTKKKNITLNHEIGIIHLAAGIWKDYEIK